MEQDELEAAPLTKADAVAMTQQLKTMVETNATLSKGLAEANADIAIFKERAKEYEDHVKKLDDVVELQKASDRLMEANITMREGVDRKRDHNREAAFYAGKILTDAEAKHDRTYNLAALMAATDKHQGSKFEDRARLELDVAKELENKAKAIGISTDGAGGYMVPDEVSSDFVELLYNNTIVGRSGATMLNVKGSPFRIPRMTSGMTQYWVAESVAITGSTPAWGEIEMTPKKSGALVLLSNEWDTLSSPGAQTLVNQDMIQAMAVAEDLACLTGNTDKRPRGIFLEPGILTTSVATSIDFTTFTGMLYQLMLNNSFFGNLAWYYAPRTWLDTSNLYDTFGRPLLHPDLTGESPLEGSIYGVKGYASNQISIDIDGDATGKTYLALVRASEILIANWGGLVIAQSEHHKFAEDQLAVRATRLVDCRLRRPEALVLDSTITAAA